MARGAFLYGGRVSDWRLIVRAPRQTLRRSHAEERVRSPVLGHEDGALIVGGADGPLPSPAIAWRREAHPTPRETKKSRMAGSALHVLACCLRLCEVPGMRPVAPKAVMH